MCDINKNRLLTLYFHEGSRREEREIQKHAHDCPECREYLTILEETDRSLHHWQDEQPPKNTWAAILEKLPQTQPKPAAKPAAAVIPQLLIAASVAIILAVIFLVHDKITLLPWWQSLQESWLVDLLGTFGMTAALFFLLGIGITLSLTPVLILESQTRKYRYYFN